MAALVKSGETLPVQWNALSALPVATAVTRNTWERGGVEILFVNAAFCRLTGYSAEELVGQNTRILHGTKTDLTPLPNNRPAHQSVGEGWLCRRDGSPFFARWNFCPLHEPGSPDGELVAVYHDHSETQRLRDALLESRKLDTVGRLASGVAHDFNILLSIINGYCEIMTRKISGVPEVKKDLEEIHRAGQKASAIARQILEFTQRHETEVKVVNYNTLIREITEILRRVAGDDVTLELRLTSGLGNARIDPTQFQQVLLNLCFNAREAMPKGGKLTIRTYNYKVAIDADRRAPGMRNGFYAAVQVTDTGHGIEAETLDRIFEPFFTTKPSGTGLGLATVRGIIRQHDGHITVQSALGSGTTFEVFLPETPEQEQITPLKTASLPITQGSESVLLIEHDGVLRKMIAGILATEGYAVTDTASVRSANSLLTKKKLKPQLVLANCQEKVVASFVVKLRAKNPRLRLVNLSGDSPAVKLPHFPAAAIAHLSKPFTLSKLTASVRQVLDARIR